MYVTFVIKLIIWQCHIRHQNSMSQNIRSGHKRLTQRFLHYTIHDENIIVTWWFMMISTVTNTSSNLTSHRQFVMKLVLYDALTNYTWCWVSSQNSTLYDAAFGSSQKVTTLRDDFKKSSCPDIMWPSFYDDTHDTQFLSQKKIYDEICVIYDYFVLS